MVLFSSIRIYFRHATVSRYCWSSIKNIWRNGTSNIIQPFMTAFNICCSSQYGTRLWNTSVAIFLVKNDVHIQTLSLLIAAQYITMASLWVRLRLKSPASHCLLNGLFRRRSKKNSKLSVTGLCAGNSPVTGDFPAQMASDAENVPIWWRHHDPEVTN